MLRQARRTSYPSEPPPNRIRRRIRAKSPHPDGVAQVFSKGRILLGNPLDRVPNPVRNRLADSFTVRFRQLDGVQVPIEQLGHVHALAALVKQARQVVQPLGVP